MHNVGKIHKEKVQIFYQNWINEKTKVLALKASNDYKKRKEKRAIKSQSHFALVSLPQAFNLPPPTSMILNFVICGIIFLNFFKNKILILSGHESDRFDKIFATT